MPYELSIRHFRFKPQLKNNEDVWITLNSLWWWMIQCDFQSIHHADRCTTSHQESIEALHSHFIFIRNHHEHIYEASELGRKPGRMILSGKLQL